jgi:transcription elongation factor GreA
MVANRTYLTSGGLRKLEEELADLRSVRRLGVAERIQRAKELGGAVDNAEYDEAKEEQAFVEGRLQELDIMIQNAVIIPDHKGSRAKKSGMVELGSIVKVQLLATRKSETYTIVGSAETSPAEGLISNESPIGGALLGKRAGDQVEFNTPSGVQQLRIVQVR